MNFHGSVRSFSLPRKSDLVANCFSWPDLCICTALKVFSETMFLLVNPSYQK